MVYVDYEHVSAEPPPRWVRIQRAGHQRKGVEPRANLDLHVPRHGRQVRVQLPANNLSDVVDGRLSGPGIDLESDPLPGKMLNSAKCYGVPIVGDVAFDDFRQEASQLFRNDDAS